MCRASQSLFIVFFVAFATAAPARADDDQKRLERARAVIVASQPAPDYDDLVRDLMSELSLLLQKKVAAADTPIAVLVPTVSSGLSEEAARRLRISVERALASVAIDEAYCDPCGAPSVIAASDEGVRVTSGRGLAERTGARSFLQVHLAWLRTSLRLSIVLSSPAGRVTFAEDIDSDAGRAALIGRGATTADIYTSDISRQLPKSMSFGIAAMAGILRMPFKFSFLGLDRKGEINGMMFALRMYESFGLDKRFIVGAQARAFIDTDFQRNFPEGALEEGITLPASGGIITAVVGFSPPLSADLRAPRVRIGTEIGVFLGGSLGNNIAIGGIIEVLMRERFGLHVALMFVGESKSLIGPITLTVGGFTWAAGGSFNWD
ncbi:MAG: hypothetical protein IT381_20590 [Deltaproteobacteria bacterium]|nr:hypothetical protein [Deltaproteobacteria bacterium]